MNTCSGRKAEIEMRFIVCIRRVVLRLLFLALLPAATHAAPADTGPAQPGFSCGTARTTVEYLICDSQALSRADAQMSAMYAQALKATAQGDALRDQQRRWLKQREACVQGQTLKQASRNEATARCLHKSYAQRVRELRDIITPPLQPVAATALPAALLEKVLPAYPRCGAKQAAFSDDARLLALVVTCDNEQGGERRVWVIDLAHGTASPATPPLGSSDPNGEGVRNSGIRLLWQGDTLFVATSMETAGRAKGDPTYWAPRFFSARAGKSPQALQALPGDVQRKVTQSRFAGDGFAATGDEDLIEDTLFTSGKHLFWLSEGVDPSVVALYVREYPKGGKPGPAREIARGGWGLVSGLQFDTRQLIYPGDDGILIYDFGRGTSRHLATTNSRNKSLAWQPAQRKLAILGAPACGRDRNPALCIVTLPAD